MYSVLLMNMDLQNMSDTDYRSMMFELEDEVEDEKIRTLTLEEKLATEIISVEKRFYYSSESVQRKKEIRSILEKSLRNEQI